MNRRFIAAATAASLLAFTFVGTEATASMAATTAATTATPSGPTNASTAPTDTAASAIAATYDHAVTVTSDTTPTEQVTANPDGTMTLDTSVDPVRADQNGTWVPTDLTLGTSGGWIVPNATASPVRFSTGGTDVMAQVQTTDGDWLTETWPGGTLPTPQLSGAVATYPGVLPGVDLQLTATATGMAEVLVIQNAAAADNPALADLELTMPNATVSVNSQQTTVATAPDASTVTSAPPTWWDSSQTGANAAGPGGAGEPAPLPHTTDGDSVNLDVTAVATPAVTYPIYVDPDWSAGQQDYWFTDLAYPNQSYLNGNQSAGYQSVGWANQGGITYLSRAFWQFGIAPLEGKIIQSAVMDMSINYSCASTALDLSWYGPGTPGFTWNSDPNLYHSTESTYTPPSVAGCAITPTTFPINALTAVTAFAAQSKSSIQLAIRAADESGDVTSRKHLGQNASLAVTYDTAPNTPTGLTFTGPPRSCGTSVADAAWINNYAQGITVQASQSDPDGGNMFTQFQVSNAGSLGTDAISEFQTSTQAGGTVSSTHITARLLTNNTDYAIRAQTNDGVASSAWTSWCYFHIDNNTPALPSVSLSSTTPTVGSTVTANISTSDSTVRGYVAWITPGAGPEAGSTSPVSNVGPTTGYHTCNPAATGAPAIEAATYLCSTVASGSTPGTAAINFMISQPDSTIYVASIDRAGNMSAATDANGVPYVATSTEVTAAADSRVSLSSGGHSWVGDGTSSTSISDLGTSTTGVGATTHLNLGTAVTATAIGAVGPNMGSGPYPATDLNFTGAAGTPATTSGPVIDQTQSFNVSAWLAPASTTGTGVATAVSESGTAGQGFTLQQVGTEYQFCLSSATAGAQQCVSSAAGTATAGKWQFVTGVWDNPQDSTASPDGEMSIVLGANMNVQNTVIAVRAPVANDVAVTGPLAVGASTTSGTNPWVGDIVDPTIFPGVPDQAQLHAIQLFGAPPAA